MLAGLAVLALSLAITQMIADLSVRQPPAADPGGYDGQAVLCGYLRPGQVAPALPPGAAPNFRP